MARHQKPAALPQRDPDPARGLAALLAVCLGLLAFLGFAGGETNAGLFFGGLALLSAIYAHGNAIASTVRAFTAHTAPNHASAAASISELQHDALAAGGGAYLATRPSGDYVFAPPQAAVLILAGPRAGKTSCVVIPALAAHPGPAVTTSTKTEVLTATLPARQQLGHTWFLDLQGTGTPTGTQQLRWSPVTRASDWQEAQLTAEAMTGAATPDSDRGHWTERASALLACCLHAAAHSHQGMRELSGWILRHDTDTPLAELPPDSIATNVLLGIKHTADRERSGIFSTTARVLRAYRSHIALTTSENPNFDPDQFATSHDTVYIAAPAHQQQLLAPLVVGLLTDIRQATYQHTNEHGLPTTPMLFMLDECANIAPLPDLPAMLSEAGGQGLQTVVVLQDLSQARRRWKARRRRHPHPLRRQSHPLRHRRHHHPRTTLAALRRIRPTHTNHHQPPTNKLHTPLAPVQQHGKLDLTTRTPATPRPNRPNPTRPSPHHDRPALATNPHPPLPPTPRFGGTHR